MVVGQAGAAVPDSGPSGASPASSRFPSPILLSALDPAALRLYMVRRDDREVCRHPAGWWPGPQRRQNAAVPAAVHSHPEPVGGFLACHRVDAFGHRAHVVAVAHRGEGPEQQAQPQGDVLGERVAAGTGAGRAGLDAGAGEPPQDVMLDELQVAAPEARHADRGGHVRRGGGGQLPDGVLGVAGATPAHPQLVAGRGGPRRFRHHVFAPCHHGSVPRAVADPRAGHRWRPSVPVRTLACCPPRGSAAAALRERTTSVSPRCAVSRSAGASATVAAARRAPSGNRGAPGRWRPGAPDSEFIRARARTPSSLRPPSG